MTINLKQIRVFDTDNIKLDKINYNFDQLIVNGGGPKGYTGSDGPTGFQGFQGAIGIQGDRGFQGVQGDDAPSASSYWEAVPQNLLTANVMATLFAKHPGSGNTTYPPVVATGYLDSDFTYNNQQGNGLPNYQWVVNRKKSNVVSNIRFTSGDILGNGFDIKMDIIEDIFSPTTYPLYLGFIDNTNSQLNLEAEEHIIRSSSNGLDLFKISNLGGEINVDTRFQQPVTFNEKLTIDGSNADVNKVVTSVDSSSIVTFKSATELGGSVKVGTIVSILPSIFSDPTKFVCNQTIDTNSNPDAPIQIKIGAGIGDYAGWYVCNGQEWTDGGSITFQVPDLNSFSYQIIANPISLDPNSQGSISVVNDEISLIGGADMIVNAGENGVSGPLYDISITNISNDPSIEINNLGGQFKIKKLPQIIYIGTDNLYWSQLGTGQAAIGDYTSVDYDVVDYNAF